MTRQWRDAVAGRRSGHQDTSAPDGSWHRGALVEVENLDRFTVVMIDGYQVKAAIGEPFDVDAMRPELGWGRPGTIAESLPVPVNCSWRDRIERADVRWISGVDQRKSRPPAPVGFGRSPRDQPIGARKWNNIFRRQPQDAGRRGMKAGCAARTHLRPCLGSQMGSASRQQRNVADSFRIMSIQDAAPSPLLLQGEHNQAVAARF